MGVCVFSNGGNVMYNNLKSEMTRKHLSLSDLAYKMDLSKKALENKLSGLRDFTLNEIEFILKEFSDCPFEYLFDFRSDSK